MRENEHATARDQPDSPHRCFGSAGESTAAQVDQYAAFIRPSADDVVDKALNYVFSKDRDFQEFLQTPQAKQAASALPVRQAPSTSHGAAEQLPSKPTSGVETRSSARVMKA
jgi:hypothetical protein